MEKPETRRFTPHSLTLSLAAVVLVYFVLNRAADVVTYLENFSLWPCPCLWAWPLLIF